MKWVDIIRVRSARGNGASVASRMSEWAASCRGTRGLIAARVYRNADYECDASLHLVWNTPAPAPGGSELALRIFRELTGQGLVDHDVWIETKGGLQ